MNILHVVPDLDRGSLRRELALVLGGSSPAVVCALGGGPDLEGVRCERLAWGRTLDPRPLWRLGRLLRERSPDVVHAWGLDALRAVRLAAGKWPGRVVVNRPLSGRAPNLLDRWLLRGADAVLVRGEAEAARCRQAGVVEARLRVVPAGALEQPCAEEAAAIVCAGALRPEKGFWDAIWTLDILHFVRDDGQLVIVGDGPERPRLECFARATGRGHRIHFVGAEDRAAWLRRAAVVWVPSRADTGAGVALEAMAAGRPVVATRWPGLAEVVSDGETGYLVTAGDKMDLARRTRSLLDDPARRRSMGAAARRRAGERFGAAALVKNWWQAWSGGCGLAEPWAA
jgi:glycosyltransferase involved in cell wall biosynthesis